MTYNPATYPPVGKIAVTSGGYRIEIWGDESESPDCFTGMLLLPDRTDAQIRVHDLSVMWDRRKILRIEEPTTDDLRLGWLPRDEGQTVAPIGASL